MINAFNNLFIYNPFASIDKKIDFSHAPEFLQQELHKLMMDDRKGKGIVDQIVKVHLKDKSEKWILVHIEVQDNPEEDFPKRMFRYFYRILDRHQTEIYAIALITGPKQSVPKNYYHYSFHGTQLVYTYNVYQYDEKNLETLKKSANPFAHAIIAGIYAKKYKVDEEERAEVKKELLKQTLQRFAVNHQKSELYIEALTYFINFLLRLPKHLDEEVYSDIKIFMNKEDLKMSTNMSERSPFLAELGRRLGEEAAKEAAKEAIKEEKRETAIRLIHRNFTDEEIADITDLSISNIGEIRKTMNH